MEEDKELEKLKQKKLNEIMNKIEKQHDDKNPKTILKSKLIDRGEEVLDIAEKAYPNETKAVIKKLSELIKQGKIQNLISGVNRRGALKKFFIIFLKNKKNNVIFSNVTRM